jgi:hypothetical protein
MCATSEAQLGETVSNSAYLRPVPLKEIKKELAAIRAKMP